MSNLRIGLGTDTHRLVEKRKLILGGIEISHYKGCHGHSDGDAVIHAFCDSLLGAANLRDIGYHFPDNDDSNKGRNSSEFLFEVNSMLQKLNFKILNADITIQIQKPKINPHIPAMQKRLAQILSTDINNISIKAKTGEGIGIIGREEAVSVQCIAMIEKSN